MSRAGICALALVVSFDGIKRVHPQRIWCTSGRGGSGITAQRSTSCVELTTRLGTATEPAIPVTADVRRATATSMRAYASSTFRTRTDALSTAPLLLIHVGTHVPFTQGQKHRYIV